VTLLCETLGVSTSGFSAWLSREPSAAPLRRDSLLVEIRAVHAEAKGRYGSPRSHAELEDRGVECCLNTVAKLMADNDIRAKTARKSRNTTDSNHDRPVAGNVLDRQFEAGGEDYQTRAQARASIFEYLETFSNPRRRPSSLG
jgi:transposase InsO family protein